MKYFQGAVKGTVVFIVLCLAAYGAFVLLKRPAELKVSAEDRAELQKDLGIDILSNETSSGRSAFFNTVEGAPPVGSLKSSPSNTKAVPAALGGASTSPAPASDEAPAFGEAPAFASAPAASSTAPAFAASEAPAFVAAPPTLPPPPPAAIVVTPAPLYGSQISPSAPNPPPAEKPKPSQPASTPSTAAPTPGPTPITVPPFAQTPNSPPLATIPSHTNSPWDGPAANVAVPTPMPAADPWGTQAAKTSKPEAAEKTDPADKKDAVTFVAPIIKPLPKVQEEPLVHVVAEAPIPKRPEPIPQTAPVNTTIPDDYRQASIRRLSASPPQDESPVISFSPITAISPTPSPAPQTISTERPKSEPPKNEPLNIIEEQPKPAVPEYSAISDPIVPPAPTQAPAPAPSFVEPKTATAAPTESAPFPVESPISTEYVERGPSVSIPLPPTQLKSEIREPVSRFVNAQCELIRTNDPNKIRAAYIQLSRLYDHPELNVFERAYLTPILDHLAVDVIFSKRNHILEAPYVVKVGETSYTLRSGETLIVPYGNSIESIAATFNLTPALLMKINGLTNRRPLEPGTELKIVLGQFDARVSTERREFTLILGGLYAGRFPISVGEEIQGVRGEFTVTLKGDTPQGRGMTLSNGISLRSADRPQPGDSLRSAVRFSERDATELYDILSERSVVVFGK